MFLFKTRRAAAVIDRFLVGNLGRGLDNAGDAGAQGFVHGSFTISEVAEGLVDPRIDTDSEVITGTATSGINAKTAR